MKLKVFFDTIENYAIRSNRASPLPSEEFSKKQKQGGGERSYIFFYPNRKENIYFRKKKTKKICLRRKKGVASSITSDYASKRLEQYSKLALSYVGGSFLI